MIVLIANVSFSQDFFDALRYSQTNYEGSARSTAMGSAFGALGGDFISASINPAGLGFYRTGEFTISPTLNINNCESSYLGTSNTDNKYRFNFNNINYVGAVNTGAETGIVGFSFGIGYNRLKNFHSNIAITGKNAETSLLNYYTDWANKIGDYSKFDKQYEDLAWQTYLIYYDKDAAEGSKFYNELANYNEYEAKDDNGNSLGTGYELASTKPHTQKSFISRSGRIDEYLLSMGFNVNHKFFFGASMGILDLEFNERTSFSELDENNLCEDFKDYTQTSTLNHSGVGINFKTGIIYRPFKSLRVGIAVHTPNFYTISCSEDKELVANFDQPVGDNLNGTKTQWTQHPEQSYYEFQFESPFKAIISAAYSFGDKGLLSADYEYSNYASAKFRDITNYEYDYSTKNSDVENVFHSTGNLRIGGEYRLTNNFSLRAGVQLLGNPWEKKYTSDSKTISLANNSDSNRTYSAGFGYRQQNFFIDFAYRLNQVEEAYKVHELSANDPANGKNIATLNYLNNQATITFGFRF